MFVMDKFIFIPLKKAFSPAYPVYFWKPFNHPIAHVSLRNAHPFFHGYL